jgi:hypothetical protein
LRRLKHTADCNASKRRRRRKRPKTRQIAECLVEIQRFSNGLITLKVIFTVVPNIMILSEFFIYQLMHKIIVLKRILKFTLKQLGHVSV